MTDSQTTNDTTRDELLQRVALMEAMIAEGRRSTTRFGWIFVLWGLVDLAGVWWEQLRPDFNWVWPITIVSGFVIQFLIFALRGKVSLVCGKSVQTRSIGAVWSMMGLTVLLYVFPAIIQHRAGQVSYIAAILMFLGMAHAISALILRWPVQGVVAALWWAGGIGTYFLQGNYFLAIFVAEMFFGMILFGLYAMWLDRREQGGRIAAHA
jgi:hypothetical protein